MREKSVGRLASWMRRIFVCLWDGSEGAHYGRLLFCEDVVPIPHLGRDLLCHHEPARWSVEGVVVVALCGRQRRALVCQPEAIPDPRQEKVHVRIPGKAELLLPSG